jgi:hypothetical protein
MKYSRSKFSRFYQDIAVDDKTKAYPLVCVSKKMFLNFFEYYLAT